VCHVCSITSSQGSQEVRVSRYRYDPVLETLATESEVFSGMEDTASGTQVQVCDPCRTPTNLTRKVGSHSLL
jgi:hypothetical protein